MSHVSKFCSDEKFGNLCENIQELKERFAKIAFFSFWKLPKQTWIEIQHFPQFSSFSSFFSQNNSTRSYFECVKTTSMGWDFHPLPFFLCHSFLPFLPTNCSYLGRLHRNLRLFYEISGLTKDWHENSLIFICVRDVSIFIKLCNFSHWFITKVFSSSSFNEFPTFSFILFFLSAVDLKITFYLVFCRETQTRRERKIFSFFFAFMFSSLFDDPFSNTWASKFFMKTLSDGK